MNKTLTADARATIMDACQSISRSADELKNCHTVDGDWGDDLEAKAFYEAELRLLERLTALLAAQQPEPPTFEAKHISLKQKGAKLILTLELDGIEGAPRYMVTPINPSVVRPQPEPRAEVTGWQTIETAPKETELLGWRKDCGVLLIMHTSFDRWASEAECDEIDEETLFQKDWFGTALPGIMDRLEGGEAPTHWMAIPAAPSDAARAGEGQ